MSFILLIEFSIGFFHVSVVSDTRCNHFSLVGLSVECENSRRQVDDESREQQLLSARKLDKGTLLHPSPPL